MDCGVKEVTNPEEIAAYERIESTASQMTGSNDDTQRKPVSPPEIKQSISYYSEKSGGSDDEAEKIDSSVLKEFIVHDPDITRLGKLRNLAKQLIAHPYFDGSIFVVIMVSSVLLSMADYGSVNSKNDLVASGSPIDPGGSKINLVILRSELAFTAIFAFEFAVKACALGLFGEGSYFWDVWNWLDFIVVFFALFSYYPGVPNVSVFRIFRVLRPLKSIKSVPALAAIVQVMLQSLVLMRDIILVVIFLFLIFGIAGLQMFGGPYMHTRCRYTPYPVLANQTSDFYANITDTNDFAPYRCADVINFNVPKDDSSVNKRTSPWAAPRPECFWPIDNSDESFCSLDNSGNYFCDRGESGRKLWCGSNYDALGNARFDAGTADKETFIQNLGYSYLNFDNLAMSALTTFQIMAGDGWSDIMYLIAAATDPIAAGVFCVLLIMLGTFFILQLIIATLENTLVSNEEATALRKQEEDEAKLRHLRMHKLNKALSRKRQSHQVGSEGTDDDAESQLKDWDRAALPAFNLADFVSTEVIGTEDEDWLDDSISEDSVGAPQPTALEQFCIYINHYDKPDRNWFRKLCFRLCERPMFGMFFTTLILINTFVMAYDHYPMSQETTSISDSITFFLTLCFLMELIIRLLGYGIVKYFSDNFNTFDFFIVFVSMIDLALTPLPTLISGSEEEEGRGGSLSALRSFRLLRLLRLFRSHSLKLLLYKVAGVIVSMYSFVMLLFLYVFIMSLIGMQFFANRFRFEEDGNPALPITSDAWVNAPDRPRPNFDDFTQSFATIFQLVTIDNWSTLMYDCMRAQGPWASLFCVIVITTGSFMIMSMFLAILIHNFTKSDPSEEDLNEMMDAPNDDNAPNDDKHGDISDDMDDDDDTVTPKDWYNRTGRFANGVYNNIVQSYFSLKESISTSIPDVIHEWYWYSQEICNVVTEHEMFELFILVVIVASSITLAIDNPLIEPNSQEAVTLFYFDIIITSIFTVEMLMKLYAKGVYYTSKDAYFQSGWNILDFFVVVVSITALAGSGNDDLQYIKPLRALRALRPLRLVNQMPGLKALVKALLRSTKAVAQIALVFGLIYFIFAIFFTSFLKGQIRSCQGEAFDEVISPNEAYLHLLQYPVAYGNLNDEQQTWFGPASPVNPDIGPDGCTEFIDLDHLQHDQVTSRVICTCWGGSWVKDSDFLYDNVVDSMITLFDAGTLDGWSELMHIASDSRGIDMQPIRDASDYWVYIYVMFILLGNFLCVQLFVGVITSSFEACNNEIGGWAFLSPEQQEWMKTRKIITAIRPKRKNQRPEGAGLFAYIRRLCFDIISNFVFEVFIIMCILLSTTLLAIKFFGENAEMTFIIDRSNAALTGVFLIEMFLKLGGLGVRNYFQDIWNRLDCFIAVGTVTSLIVFLITREHVGIVISCIRILRVVRLIRLVKGMPTLQKLIDTIVLTIPGIGNIAILLFLFLYIFAVIAVSLFAKTAYHQSYNEDANFRSFTMAFLTLIRFTTGDNWGQFMYDLAYAGSDDCQKDPEYNPDVCGFNGQGCDGGQRGYDCEPYACIPLDGCGNVVIIPYMIVYNVLICFVFLSVFISVIISNYNEVSDVAIGPDEFQKFAEHWAEFDPDSTCYISLDSLYMFVATLFDPFGFGGKPFSMRQYMKRVGKIEVTTDRCVHFSGVILALSVAHFERKYKWRGLAFDISTKKDRKKDRHKDKETRSLAEKSEDNLSTEESRKLSRKRSSIKMVLEKTRDIIDGSKAIPKDSQYRSIPFEQGISISTDSPDKQSTSTIHEPGSSNSPDNLSKRQNYMLRSDSQSTSKSKASSTGSMVSSEKSIFSENFKPTVRHYMAADLISALWRLRKMEREHKNDERAQSITPRTRSSIEASESSKRRGSKLKSAKPQNVVAYTTEEDIALIKAQLAGRCGGWKEKLELRASKQASYQLQEIQKKRDVVLLDSNAYEIAGQSEIFNKIKRRYSTLPIEDQTYNLANFANSDSERSRSGSADSTASGGEERDVEDGSPQEVRTGYKRGSLMQTISTVVRRVSSAAGYGVQAHASSGSGDGGDGDGDGEVELTYEDIAKSAEAWNGKVLVSVNAPRERGSDDSSSSKSFFPASDSSSGGDERKVDEPSAQVDIYPIEQDLDILEGEGGINVSIVCSSISKDDFEKDTLIAFLQAENIRLMNIIKSPDGKGGSESSDSYEEQSTAAIPLNSSSISESSGFERKIALQTVYGKVPSMDFSSASSSEMLDGGRENLSRVERAEESVEIVHQDGTGGLDEYFDTPSSIYERYEVMGKFKVEPGRAHHRHKEEDTMRSMASGSNGNDARSTDSLERLKSERLKRRLMLSEKVLNVIDLAGTGKSADEGEAEVVDVKGDGDGDGDGDGMADITTLKPLITVLSQMESSAIDSFSDDNPNTNTGPFYTGGGNDSGNDNHTHNGNAKPNPTPNTSLVDSKVDAVMSPKSIRDPKFNLFPYEDDDISNLSETSTSQVSNINLSQSRDEEEEKKKKKIKMAQRMKAVGMEWWDDV